MYKILLRSSILLISIAILFAIYILVYFSNKSNTITIQPNEYVKILEQVHNDVDMYVGKKFIISGYVYIQDDFLPNHFVIAQNVYVNSISSEEPFIVGFLCENRSDTNIIANENVQITGTLYKGTYNDVVYPILIISDIT